jgi:hypothetical protein
MVPERLSAIALFYRGVLYPGDARTCSSKKMKNEQRTNEQFAATFPVVHCSLFIVHFPQPQRFLAIGNNHWTADHSMDAVALPPWYTPLRVKGDNSELANEHQRGRAFLSQSGPGAG